jgi:hypothetical protein
MSRRRTAEEVTRMLWDADRDLAKGLTVSDICRKQERTGGGPAGRRQSEEWNPWNPWIVDRNPRRAQNWQNWNQSSNFEA